MFRIVLSLLICTCVAVSPTFAGGGSGGAKKDAKIKILHDLAGTNLSLIVIADPPVSLVNLMNAGQASPRDITNAGGIIIKKGATGTLSVKSGKVPVYGTVWANGVTGKVEIPQMEEVTVGKNQTVSVKASDAF
jgi:hypothetical protein